MNEGNQRMYDKLMEIGRKKVDHKVYLENFSTEILCLKEEIDESLYPLLSEYINSLYNLKESLKNEENKLEINLRNLLKKKLSEK